MTSRRKLSELMTTASATLAAPPPLRLIALSHLRAATPGRRLVLTCERQRATDDHGERGKHESFHVSSTSTADLKVRPT